MLLKVRVPGQLLCAGDKSLLADPRVVADTSKWEGGGMGHVRCLHEAWIYNDLLHTDVCHDHLLIDSPRHEGEIALFHDCLVINGVIQSLDRVILPPLDHGEVIITLILDVSTQY